MAQAVQPRLLSLHSTCSALCIGARRNPAGALWPCIIPPPAINDSLFAARHAQDRFAVLSRAYNVGAMSS